MTVRRRLPVALGAVCLVLSGMVAVVVAVGQDDDPEPVAEDGDDIAADVLGDEALELLHQAEPDPSCASEPTAPPDDGNLMALDVMWLEGTCLKTRTEYVAEHDVAARRQELAEDPAVVVAGVSPPVFLDGSSVAERPAQSDDDRRDDQWGLDVLEPEDAPDPAWPDGRGAVVAVLDSGIHAAHGDLGDAVIGRRHLRDEAELDPDGHGTHVAGIIAARRGNGGIVGVAPEASILDVPIAMQRPPLEDGGRVRVLNDGASPWTGLVWAVNSGATVANLSFGSPLARAQEHGTVQVTVAALEFARHNQVVVVAAAGNCGPDPEEFGEKGDNGLAFGCDEVNQRRLPAMLNDLVVAVGAVLEDDDDLRLAGYSPRNEDVDLVAPGHENVSTYPPGLGGDEDEVGSETRAYQTMGATSQAAPHVAGAVAVAQSVYPTATRDQVVQALVRSADPDRLPEGERSDPGVGSGLLDVVSLVDELRTAATPDPGELAGRTQVAFVREEMLYAFDGSRAHPVRPVGSDAPVTWLAWSDDHERLVGLSGTNLFSWVGPGTQPVEIPYQLSCGGCGPSLAYLDDDSQPVDQQRDVVVSLHYDGILTQYDAATLEELGSTTLSFPADAVGTKTLHGVVGGRLVVHESGGAHASERLWLVDPASGEAGESREVAGLVQGDVAVAAGDDRIAFVAGYSPCSDTNRVYVLDGEDLSEVAQPVMPPGTTVDELFFNGDTIYATMTSLPSGDPAPCAEEQGSLAGIWRLAGERWEQVHSGALANARPLEGRAGDEPTGWLVVELDGTGSLRPFPSDDTTLGDLGRVDREIWSTPTRDEVDLGSATGGGVPGGGDPGRGGSGGSAPTQSKPSELPDPMVGRWEGSVTQQSSGTTYPVEMTLFARDADDRVGSVSYPTLGCEGYYTLGSGDDKGVTLVEHITVGADGCIDGVEIVLTTLDADHLSYRFEYAGNPADGQGTLTRSG